ncbi:MAG TPA: TonB-dependent receptor plug domain-containing protein [Mucilaginibacter sp.]
MNKYNTPLLTAVLLLLAFFVSAQTPALDQTLFKLQKQAAALPFEKVYLHFDKPYYSAGDTIWFKAYDVLGPHHALSALSKVLYVELINQQGNTIVQNIKLYLTEGTDYGDFALPDTLQEGNYRIRAYTNWMRNAGQEYFFDKTFTIVNAISNKVFVQSSSAYVIQNNQQMVNTIITYTDIEGKPYAGKDVRYEVQLDPQNITKGKGITDEKGRLNIVFANPVSNISGSGQIMIPIALDNQKTVTKNIAIKTTTSKGRLHITFANPVSNISGSGQIMTAIALDNQKIVTKNIAIKATIPKVDVQFFPESGSLVNGLTSKVAFKAVGSDGLGVDINGVVVDDENNEITKFTTSHLGMGTFILNPQAGRSYKANITYTDGSTEMIALPKALDKGYVLTIDTQKDSSNIIVKITGTGYEKQKEGVSLVAQSGGEVYLQGQGEPGKLNFTSVIPRNKLPSGVIQFTLFSPNGEPLNERLVFIQNPDKLKLDVNTASQSYTARQKVKVNLKAKNPDSQPIRGDFSVAVIDESKVPVDETTESTILSNLLLTSDIKGYIEKPNYYFNNLTEKTQSDFDVLMLTQGYHRFEWKQVMSDTVSKVVYQPEKTTVIAGQVKMANGKPAAKAKITLMSNSGVYFATDTITDNNGRFAFHRDYPDDIKLSIKAIGVNGDDNLNLELDNDIPSFKINKNAADIQVNVNNGLAAYLQNSKKQYEEALKYGVGNHSIVLNDVTINNAKAKTPREIAVAKAVEFSSNLNGKGVADQVVTAEDLEKFTCVRLSDCLSGRLAGVGVNIGSGIPYLYSAAINPQTFKRTPMQFILDNRFVDYSEISAMDINNISSIEVLRSGGYLAAYGVRAAGGIMIFTTKQGAGRVAAGLKKSISYIQPKGYYKTREFYSPQYDNPKINTQISDLRTTIFWKPVLKTDDAGNASFEYFNADSKGTYRVVIEGIDYEGNIGRQVYRYKVQ